MNPRTIERWVEYYVANAGSGLISQRAAWPGVGSKTDPRLRETALKVMCEELTPAPE